MTLHIGYDNRSMLTYHPDCGCVYEVLTGRIKTKCEEHAWLLGGCAQEMLETLAATISPPERVNCDGCGYNHDPSLSCDEWAAEERLARAVPERWS